MKGITLACASCKGILLRYANIKGEGSFETICKHCGALNKVEIHQKTYMVSKIVYAILIASFLVSGMYLITIHSIVRQIAKYHSN